MLPSQLDVVDKGSVPSIDIYALGRKAGRMARKLRVEYEGAIYHVMNRGDGGEAVFQDDEDRHGFVRVLGEACEKTGWQVSG